MTTYPNDRDRPRSPVLTLRQACLKSGFYGGGTRCPTCPLHHLCANDDRWAVPLGECAGSA